MEGDKTLRQFIQHGVGWVNTDAGGIWDETGECGFESEGLVAPLDEVYDVLAKHGIDIDADITGIRSPEMRRRVRDGFVIDMTLSIMREKPDATDEQIRSVVLDILALTHKTVNEMRAARGAPPVEDD